MSATVAAKPQAFTLRVEDSVLEDLRTRLRRARFPDQAPGEPWAYGTEVEYMRGLTKYWGEQFDWRVWEAKLNAFPQFKVPLHGIDLHYLKVDGKGPNPQPLLLSHGWPGSVFEFLKVIPRLTDPASFGGDPKDSFTVIAPSLPGYGLSFNPNQPRFSIEQVADCFADLMTHVLGYSTFAAQGGDWGAFVTSRLGYSHPEKLIGIHVNLLTIRRDPSLLKNPTPEEQVFIDRLNHFLKEETGYQWIQGTKPQTLAFALTDSPIGLAAWIVEKFRVWSDCGGNVESVFTRDELLSNITFYWVTQAIGSSFWPYYARMHGPWPIPGKVDVPMGYTAFPKEILQPPRSVAQTMFGDIRRWSVMAKGGHFAAMEQPDALVHEIREFFRPLRR